MRHPDMLAASDAEKIRHTLAAEYRLAARFDINIFLDYGIPALVRGTDYFIKMFAEHRQKILRSCFIIVYLRHRARKLKPNFAAPHIRFIIFRTQRTVVKLTEAVSELYVIMVIKK